MATDLQQLASRLLDAQVRFVLDELTGDRLTEVIARDVPDILGVLDRIVVNDAVDRDAAKATVREYVGMVGDSEPIQVLATGLAEAVYTLAAADDSHLGEVIGREHVEALVAKVLGMEQLHDRALERLGESPLVATVASWFVNKIVTDFMRSNAEIAGKVPGVGMMLAAGRKTTERVRKEADRHLGDVLGDAAGKGAQFALRRLSKAIRETMKEAPLDAAVLEFWDLHADEPVSSLRQYLTQQDLADLVAIIHEMWLTLRDTDYFAAAVDAGLDVFFDEYGAHTVGALLDELGVDRAHLEADAQLLVPQALAALRETGLLEELVRARLEPFWTSEETLALLA